MKKVLFLLIPIILFIFAIIYAKPVETQLLEAFITPSSVEEGNLVKLADLSSKKLNILLEAGTIDELEDLKQEFSIQNRNFSDLVQIYRKYPANFLTKNKRKLIAGKNYQKIEQEALEGIYNPLGIYIVPINQDPYLLATDYLMEKTKFAQDEVKKSGEKYYTALHLDINNNYELKKIIKKAEGKSVYLTGTPVHTYYQTQKSNLEINFMCLISTLMFIFLVRFYFKSTKIVIPIALSILFGFICGYTFAALIFRKLHILTFVFSTSLIGISLDYSLHYFITGQDREFNKSLTSSMLTTVLAFLTLLFSNIEVLKQIAVFTSAGLIGVWAFVLIILPCFKNKLNLNEITGFVPPKSLKSDAITILILIPLIILFGLPRIKFEDNIKNFYTPPQNLIKSETLYQNVFRTNIPEFIIVKGKSTDEILKKEEAMNIPDSISLSNFVQSTSKQNENINLIKTLYKEDWTHFRKLLGFEMQEPDYKICNPDEFPLIGEFMLDKNTSFIMTRGKTTNSINIADEVSKILHRLRKHCLILLPAVFGVLFLLLSLAYGVKNALKISVSPFIAILFTPALLALFGIPLNLFHILALFLVIGFSLDYSIFRLKGSEKSKDAVFMSMFSTAFSFFLLALTSFKLISSLGLTLCIGISISYLLSIFMIKSKHDKG